MVQEVLQAVLPEWTGELTCEEELRGAETLAVRRDAGLGDCIMIQATWATLAARMPWLKMTFFCPDGLRELFEPDPALADVRAYDQFTGGYDVSVDLHMYVELHPAAQIADRTALFATAFGIEVARSPRVYLPDYELPVRRKPSVAITMYGKYPHRSWPIEHVEELGRRCIGAGYEVCYLSEFAKDEGQLGPGRYCCGRPLTELARLVAGCDVVVSPDTGTLHLAGALQHYGRARVVGIFGPWDPLLRVTPYKYVRYHINRELACVPCFESAEHLMCAPGEIDHPCMRSISPEQVFGSVQAIIAEGGVKR